MQNGTATFENNLAISYKPTMWPSGFTLGIYPREKKISVHTKTCTLFMIALSIIAPNWKQHKCPSVGEWINKLWYIQHLKVTNYW